MGVIMYVICGGECVLSRPMQFVKDQLVGHGRVDFDSQMHLAAVIPVYSSDGLLTWMFQLN